jgi:hypothetical protein
MNSRQAPHMNRRKTMAITAKENGGKDFKKVPPGAHFAICNMVVDCGLQEGFQKKPQHKVYLRWEVPDERVSYEKDGQAIEGPCSIGRFYTLSLSDKANLRKDLENWRGKTFTGDELKGFDLESILGKCCQIMVTHETDNGKTYANITGVMGVSRDQMPRAKGAKAENPLLSFSLEQPDQGKFDQLPNWLKEKIDGRISPEETKPTPAKAAADDEFDDDIPF